MTEFTIERKPLGPDAAALGIIRSAYHSLEEKSWFAVDPDEPLGEGDGYLYMAYSDGVPCGVLTMAYPGVLAAECGIAAPSADMDIAAVLPSFRGNGLMRRMMERAEEDAAADGISLLLATVHPDNAASRHTMEMLGYRPVRRSLMYGGFDRLIMLHSLMLTASR